MLKLKCKNQSLRADQPLFKTILTSETKKEEFQQLGFCQAIDLMYFNVKLKRCKRRKSLYPGITSTLAKVTLPFLSSLYYIKATAMQFHIAVTLFGVVFFCVSLKGDISTHQNYSKNPLSFKFLIRGFHRLLYQESINFTCTIL